MYMHEPSESTENLAPRYRYTRHDLGVGRGYPGAGNLPFGAAALRFVFRRRARQMTILKIALQLTIRSTRSNRDASRALLRSPRLQVRG